MAQAITLARPYARAAFELAHGAGSLGAWSQALAFATEVAKDARVANFGNDPRVQPEQLVALHLPQGMAADAPFARFLEEERVEAVVAVHAPFACVNYDGPAAAWAEAVSTACGWPVRPQIGYPTPGSLGSWLGIDRGIPILTLELPGGPLASYRAGAASALDRAVDYWSGRSSGRGPDRSSDRSSGRSSGRSSE